MAGASRPPENFDRGENVDGGPGEKKSAWSVTIRPPNGSVADVPVIGGSSSWPALSEAARATASPKLLPVIPVPDSSAVIQMGSSVTTTTVTATASAAPAPKKASNSRNKPPTKRGHGGGSSTGGYPSAPPPPPAELLQHRPPFNRRGNGNNSSSHHNYPPPPRHMPPPPPWPQFVRLSPPPPPSSRSPPPAAFIGALPPVSPYVAPPIALPFPGGEMPPRMFYPPPPPPPLPFFAHPVRMPPAGYPVPGDYPSVLVKQIEYYFSNDNLCKDVFLRGKMDDQGWVHISVIANFKKVKEYTNNITNRIQYILDSVRNSDMVEVQGEKIRKRDNWMVWLLHPQANQHGTASSPQSPSTSPHHNLVDRMQNVGPEERA